VLGPLRPLLQVSCQQALGIRGAELRGSTCFKASWHGGGVVMALLVVLGSWCLCTCMWCLDTCTWWYVTQQFQASRVRSITCSKHHLFEASLVRSMSCRWASKGTERKSHSSMFLASLPGLLHATSLGVLVSTNAFLLDNIRHKRKAKESVLRGCVAMLLGCLVRAYDNSRCCLTNHDVV